MASLDLFADGSLLAQARERSTQLRAGVEELTAIQSVGDIRTIGMVAAIELVKDRVGKEPVGREVTRRIYRRSLEEGLILRPLGHVIYLWLPLCTSSAELGDILGRTETVLKAVLE